MNYFSLKKSSHYFMQTVAVHDYIFLNIYIIIKFSEFQLTWMIRVEAPFHNIVKTSFLVRFTFHWEYICIA